MPAAISSVRANITHYDHASSLCIFLPWRKLEAIPGHRDWRCVSRTSPLGYGQVKQSSVLYCRDRQLFSRRLSLKPSLSYSRFVLQGTRPDSTQPSHAHRARKFLRVAKMDHSAGPPRFTQNLIVILNYVINVMAPFKRSVPKTTSGHRLGYK